MAQNVSIGAIAPVLSVIDGQPTTTSRDIAHLFGKRHERVLDAARTLIAELPETAQHNFVLSEYTDATGRTLPAYRMTRDGFTLLAMGFSGKRALAFKLAYITAFNSMEAQLQAVTPYSVAPGQTLSAEQADTLRGLLTSFAESMPKDLRAQIMIQGWSKLKAHFKADYRHIPAGQFTEAVSILGRHIAHWAPADPQKTLIGLTAPAADYTPTLRGRRWVISVDWEGKEHVTPVADGAMIYTWEQVLRRVAINDELPKGFLLELANAAMSALYKANQASATPRQQVLS